MGNFLSGRASRAYEEKEYIKLYLYKDDNFQPVFEAEWSQIAYVHMLKNNNDKTAIIVWKDPNNQPITINADRYDIYTRKLSKTTLSK